MDGVVFIPLVNKGEPPVCARTYSHHSVEDTAHVTHLVSKVKSNTRRVQKTFTQPVLGIIVGQIECNQVISQRHAVWCQ